MFRRATYELIIAFCLFVHLPLSDAPAGGGPGRVLAPGTVILIHGFMRGRGSMWALNRKLKKEGYRTVNWGYDSRCRTISGHAADLVEELGVISRRHPGEPIHFVTHSMGGLIVRSALNMAGVPREALLGSAVTIAAPHDGAILAEKLGNNPLGRLVMGAEAGRELRGNNNFDRFGSFPSGLPVLVIAGDFGFNPLIPGKDDGKVACSETRLKTDHEYRQLHAGHSWITWHPETIRLTRDFIRRSRAPHNALNTLQKDLNELE